jgi:putative solute:sodium symporter small subunit
MARAAPERGEGVTDQRAAERSRGYWRANTKLQFGLLAVWAIVGYVLAILLARPLNEIVIGGFPLGYWFAQQGSIYVFVILIFIYAIRMDRVDRDFDVHEQELGAARKRAERRLHGDDDGHAPSSNERRGDSR